MAKEETKELGKKVLHLLASNGGMQKKMKVDEFIQLENGSQNEVVSYLFKCHYIRREVSRIEDGDIEYFYVLTPDGQEYVGTLFIEALEA